MKEDTITISVLPDGTLKVETDQVSGANHMNAEQFLAFMARLQGGETEVRHKRGHSHTHSHTHQHA